MPPLLAPATRLLAAVVVVVFLKKASLITNLKNDFNMETYWVLLKLQT
jgi:hypothetical protein